MSDNATGRHPDVSMTRRNPGLGHISAAQCAFCDARSANQAGWGRKFNLIACPEHKAKPVQKAKKPA